MLQVSENEVKKRFIFDNSWWEDGGNIPHLIQEYPKRFYFEPFYSLIQEMSVNRATILMGPRRVGKTVIVYQTIKKLIEDNVQPNKIFYLSLETPIYTGLSLDKIVSIYRESFNHSRNEKAYIFFDEIQYLKNWEVHLKSLVDSYPSYKFVATGSAAAALRLKSRESGAGRFTDFMLPPLTFAEYLNFINKENRLLKHIEGHDEEGDDYKAVDIIELNNEFLNYLNFGGYPEAVFSTTIQQQSSRYIKSDIIDKVLLRDLPSLYGINDIQDLNRLFTTIAYNTGQEVSLESLSKTSGISKNTLKRYLEYLEAAFLIKRVYRVDDNSKRFKRVTSFKVYLTNPSMRAALFGYAQEDSDEMGALTETAIYGQWLHSENIEKLFYARWKTGEVDIVAVSPNNQKPFWCVEVKWSDNPVKDKKLLKSLIHFSQINYLDSGLVTTKTVNNRNIFSGIDITFRPSSEYAYTLGKNILDHKQIREPDLN